MVIQILLYLAISCFLTKQQIRAIHLIINELRFIRCVSLVTVSPVITHVARHTAATIVFLANKVSLENVAKILGHSNVRTTQHYAKVLDSSIMRDIQEVDKKFSL
nr:tyrosine-type recombinase/integrase [Dysgonomonas sp.]